VAGVTIETHLVPGHVVDGVIGLIKQLKANLLVVALWVIRSSTSAL